MSQVRFISADAARLVRAIDADSGEKLRVATAGVLAFQDKRWDQDYVRHRLSMEGLAAVRPFLGPRRVREVDYEVFVELLRK
eukprot:CAMPEP_0206264354 /NCGR_PEP_ID=MMETSP0047_2-20121206/29352_1 /ASSEMBLY_ACC=CAM_ASM_000192 /TAXON_ID=195065 /ORGANISM="Chroomonas mesostigmatica_cf, Strain CCMP1168" /LENGTH=81 /DNA_ID=CAMNT_0053692047 /DNA_START=9 /DNA_END=251 /DNA_ORIENTATION=-